ncbi:hypothetical protein D9M71_822000 [compost metagenome]
MLAARPWTRGASSGACPGNQLSPMATPISPSAATQNSSGAAVLRRGERLAACSDQASSMIATARTQ